MNKKKPTAANKQKNDLYLSLLPAWAIEVDNLEYDKKFNKEGLYYVLKDDLGKSGSRVTAVGCVYKDVNDPWAVKKVSSIRCRSILVVGEDGKSAYSRTRLFGYNYVEGEKIAIANGYNEDDQYIECKEPAPVWITKDIQGMVKHMKELLRK